MGEALTLSQEVLRWAASQAGETLEALAEQVSRREQDRARVVEGKLTSPQVEKVSKLTGVPFGLLFLDRPPKIDQPALPDLRQKVQPTPLGRDFQDVLQDVLRKQQWYLDRLKQLGALPLSFVGRYAPPDRSKAGEIAADIVRELDISPELRKQAASADEYFGLIAARAESIGILVMKSGIVKSNTRRALSVDEFRGFAIADRFAPLVFINGRDAIVASVFTLVHELAHLWVGESGVSDLGTPALRGVERICNQIAAEVLVPRQEFLREWTSGPEISRLARYFRVSRLVIARRALDLNQIDQSAYAEVANAPTPPKRDSGGGDPYRTIPSRNSKRFTRALVRSAMSGETLLREAASLLGVRPSTVVELGRREVKLG